jgi:hypothetical protein
MEALAKVLAGEVDASGACERATGARTSTWVAWEAVVTARDARKLVMDGRRLRRRPRVREAALSGWATPQQADAIVRCVEDAEGHLGTPELESMESTLLGEARQLDSWGLKQCGARVLAHLAPEAVEADDAKRAEAEYRRAWRQRSLVFQDLGGGSVGFRGQLPAADGELLRRLVAARAEAAKAAHRATEARDPSIQPADQAQLMADGLVALIEAAAQAPGAPKAGGEPVRVTAVIDFDKLRARAAARPGGSRGGDATAAGHPDGSGDAAAGRLDHYPGGVDPAAGRLGDGPGGDDPAAGRPGGSRGGDATAAGRPDGSGDAAAGRLNHYPGGSGDPAAGRLGGGPGGVGKALSATELRLMACRAEILPAVLGGAGEVLDFGRARRFAPPALRRALELRDGGCVMPGCDQPAQACDVHHTEPFWSQAGRTSLGATILLCRVHHQLLEPSHLQGQSDAVADPERWEVVFVSGLPAVRPPARVDPTRKPRLHQRLQLRKAASGPTRAAAENPAPRPGNGRCRPG